MNDVIISGEKIVRLFEYAKFLEDDFLECNRKAARDVSLESILNKEMSYELYLGMSEAIDSIGLNELYCEWKRSL